MNVLGTITLDMQRPGYAVIYAVQFDKLTRQITAQLTDKGLPWTVPAGALMTIRYSKPDGTQGFYDTLEDGTTAYTISGSAVTFTLAQQALAAAGNVLMQLTFYTAGGEALSSFSFIVTVQPSVLNDAEVVSSDYYNVLTGILSEEYAKFEQLLKAGYGAPLKAATVADMTDTSKIYVYTGSETGYTAGHWYYYNGTAWTDGGVYNAVAVNTDTTLTLAGVPADAKATGDQLGELKSDLATRTLYVDASTIQKFNKGVVVNSYGRYAINHPESVNLTNANGHTYVYANSSISVNSGYTLRVAIWDIEFTSSTNVSHRLFMSGAVVGGSVTIPVSGYIALSISNINDEPISSNITAQEFAVAAISTYNLLTDTVKDKISDIEQDIDDANVSIEEVFTKNRIIRNLSGLYEAQKDIAEDWHLPFIDLYNQMELGANHQIPGTAKIWNSAGTVDLVQKNIWMSDGTHPFRGVGLVDMYGRTIANQLALVSPSYHDGAGQTTPSYWSGKHFLWMGTSIPAGSDPEAGDGTGATYPTLVAEQLGATSHNISRGSSMMRIASSTGAYQGIPFSHFLRAFTRTIAEADVIAANWSTLQPLIPSAPSTLTTEHVQTMKNVSYESLLIPYLDGTNSAPDLFVIDHGHNDTANNLEGERDWWVKPTLENITNGVLAEDSYMTANNYANLKTALNNDLSGISNIAAFAASLNRNCMQGAFNFLLTVILRYKPYARIVIVSDYN